MLAAIWPYTRRATQAKTAQQLATATTDPARLATQTANIANIFVSICDQFITFRSLLHGAFTLGDLCRQSFLIFVCWVGCSFAVV